MTELIKNGESITLEFKESFDREAIETIGALANTHGGSVLIGVRDKGQIAGVTVSRETLANWTNQIAQQTEPTIQVELETVLIEDKTIVRIRVSEYPLKPVAVKGRCFRRVASSNRQMSPPEIAQMHLQSTGNSWDAMPSPNKTSADLNLAKLNKYLKTARTNGRRAFDPDDEPLDILRKLELLRENQPTWAAILLFGRQPQSPLSQAQVHCGRFKNETIIIDDRLIAGSVTDQVDEVMTFIQKHINVRFVITGKPQRDQIWDYPLPALREAVINAVCHRDYADNADIQLKIFDDRIQLWNPGLLPFGLTVDELYQPHHSSKPRNKQIAAVFYDLGLIERYGSGIQKMISLCREAGLPRPELMESSGGFLVIFRKNPEQGQHGNGIELVSTEKIVVDFLRRHQRINNKAYRELFAVSERTALRELKALVAKGILVKVGSTGRGTVYELAHKPATNPS